jgi:wyosine [tRNA(Phe)-imidazoG37] synthetase (radical SAM superfamily)
MNESNNRDSLSPTRHHPRQWRDHLYVYPVISRRSRGLSVGVNLSHDKRCTFACAYCQVRRGGPCAAGSLDLSRLRSELRETILEATSGFLWNEPRFAQTPAAMRRLHDIAFSGDGEPTLLEDFDRALASAADVREEMSLHELKIIVITNASALHRPPFQRALPLLSPQDEIWAKLDAGTEELFQRINRPYPAVTLRRILDNILAVARLRPVVIQGLFLRLEGVAPSQEQIAAYCCRLQEIAHGGGKIQLVQVYTVARAPAEAAATPLTQPELEAIAQRLRAAMPGVTVETFV